MSNRIDPSQIYRSAVLAVALQWTVRLIGLVSVLFLARLLTPEDFGIVGLAIASLELVELLGAVGLRQALLRIEAPRREHLDTAWTIQLILFGAMGALALALAQPIAAFYREPALAAVLAVLSLRFFCLGAINIGIVDFDRHLQFGKDLRMRLSARITSFFVTMTAALLLRNYWALVVGLVSYSALLAVASYRAHPYRPRLSLAKRSELLGTSFWIFITAVAQAVQLQIERLVLGRFGTAHLVGLYSMSKDLSIIFTHEIATALNRVTFVTVARTGRPLNEQPLRVAQMLGVYAMIAAPMGLGLAATAEDAIQVLLGAQWRGAAPLLEMVAIYTAFYAVYKVIVSALQAAGHARRVACVSGLGTFFLAVAVASAAWIRPDAQTVAAAAGGANLVLLLVGIVMIARMSGIAVLSLGMHVLRPFLAASLMAAGVRFALPDSGYPLLDMLTAVAFGAVAYPILLVGIWAAAGRPKGAESEALLQAGGLLAQRSRGSKGA